MGRRQTDSKVCRSALPVLFLLGMVSVCMVLLWLPAVLKSTGNTAINQVLDLVENDSGGSGAEEIEEEVCCRGFEHLELWGDAVKWGAKHKMNSSRECCMACKGMCGSNGGPCLCNSWVFCGNRDACGPRFGECWLKKQKSSLYPDQRDSGNHVMWTSGLIFRKGEIGQLTIRMPAYCREFPRHSHPKDAELDGLPRRHFEGQDLLGAN